MGAERSPRELPVLTRREFLIGTGALAGASALALAGCGGGTGFRPTPTPSRWLRLSTAGLQPGRPRWTAFDIAPGLGTPYSPPPSVPPSGASAGAASSAAPSASPASGPTITAGPPPAQVAGGTPPPSPQPGLGGAWLVMGVEDEIVAYVPVCTHEGCFYDWNTDSARFVCRCHQGIFAIDGAVVSGPPPRPLARYATRPAGPDAIEIGWVDPA